MTQVERYIEESVGRPGTLDSLYQRVKKRREAGVSRDQVYEELMAAMLELRELGREEDEDEVLEVMDAVSGWCAPDARL